MLISIHLTQTVCSSQKKISIPKVASARSKASSHLVLHGRAGLWVSLGMCPEDPSVGPEISRTGVCHGGEGSAGGLSIGRWHSP